MAAILHVALAPKSNLALCYGLAHILIENDWVDHEFLKEQITGFEAFAAFVRDFTTEHTAAATDIAVERIPNEPSWAYDQIIDGVENGNIKALWIIATNPAHSWIHQGRFRGLLSKLEFLVVQDMYHSTETAQLADLVLPGAGWGEKEGTFINSERRIGVASKVSSPAGESKPDFAIFRLLADAWGCGPLFQEWSSPEAVFPIMKRCSKGQPCDITGIRDFKMIEDQGGNQWPVRESDADPLQDRRLFSDGKFFTKDHRAQFLFDAPTPMAEPLDATYPLMLLTGRGSSAQWHTETRTGKSAILKKLHPSELWMELHPRDAGSNIRMGDWITVESPRGQVCARARISPTVQPGQLFLPMHHDDVNKLTYGQFDPHSRQLSYKACAVRISTAARA